jgi:hypothetical protein
MIYLWIAIVLVLNGAAGLAGAVLPEAWLERYRTPMLALAAVTLLASGLLELLPEAMVRRGDVTSTTFARSRRWRCSARMRCTT